MATTFYVLMLKRADGVVSADLAKSLPTMFLTEHGALERLCEDDALARHRHVVEMVAMTRTEYDDLVARVTSDEVFKEP